MAATIGIKIANGEFYSILEENSSTKKRLILTTVHDKQTSVQIDLYKSNSKTMADAVYIGSLVVENIKSRPKGDPSVELIIKSDYSGNISADVADMDPVSAKEHHYLNISLKTMDEDNKEYDIPDFELEANSPPLGLYEKDNAEEKGRSSLTWFMVLLVFLFVIVLCFGIWYFLLRKNNVSFRSVSWTGTETEIQGSREMNASAASVDLIETQAQVLQPAVSQASVTIQPAVEVSQPVSSNLSVQTNPSTPSTQSTSPPRGAQTPLPRESAASQGSAIQTVQVQLPVIIQTPAQAPVPQRVRPVPPVFSFRVPATIPREGVSYKVRYGDTLWDIASVFYRNPWLYPRIARHNNIRNPDRILAGTTIRVPPRN